MDGIQNKAILARFENKSLMYNNLLTVNTSNPQAAYLGNPNLFQGAPPIDFAETDLGYVGSQNKFLLKIPQGQITADAKRGQVFLIAGTQAVDLSAFGSGLNRFFTDHLAFEILRYFPQADVDNHFNGLGLHGVYDSKYDRVIISKLDYIPVSGKGVKYDADTKEFYVEEVINAYCPPTTSTTSSYSTSTTSSTTSTSTSTSTTTSTSTSTTTSTTTTAPSDFYSNVVEVQVEGDICTEVEPLLVMYSTVSISIGQYVCANDGVTDKVYRKLSDNLGPTYTLTYNGVQNADCTVILC